MLFERSRRRGLAAFVVIGCGAACSLQSIPDLTSGSSTSTDGGPNGNPDGAGPGPGPGSSSSGEGGAGDAAADAPPTLPSFCAGPRRGAPMAAFCDDFDAPNETVTTNWIPLANPSPVANASALDSTVWTSPPRSLLTPRLADAKCNSVVSRVFDKASHAHVGFQLRVDDPDPTDPTTGAVLATIAFTGTNDTCAVLLGVSGGSFTLAYGETAAPIPGGAFDTILPQVWTHVEIDYRPASNSVVISINGAQGYSSGSLPDCAATPGTLTVSLGITCTLDTTAYGPVHHDDVVIDLE